MKATPLHAPAPDQRPEPAAVPVAVVAARVSPLDELRTSLRGRLPRDGAVMLLARVTSDRVLRGQVEANIRARVWPEFAIESRAATECGSRPTLRPHVVRKGASHAVPAVGCGDAAGARPGGNPDRPASAPVAAGEPGPAAGDAAGRPVAEKDAAPWVKKIQSDHLRINLRAAVANAVGPLPLIRVVPNDNDKHRVVRAIRNGEWPEFAVELRKLPGGRGPGTWCVQSSSGVEIAAPPPAPPEPVHAPRRACDCVRPDYCYACTTPDERARLDAALVESGKDTLTRLEEVAAKGEELARSVRPESAQAAPACTGAAPSATVARPRTPDVESARIDKVIRVLVAARDAEVADVTDAFNDIIARMEKLKGVPTP